MEFGPRRVDVDARAQFAPCEVEFAVDAVSVRATQVAAGVERQVVDARTDWIVAVVDSSQRARGGGDLLPTLAVSGACMRLGQGDGEGAVLCREFARSGQMPNGGVRIAGGESESAQARMGVGVDRVESSRLLVLAVGGVELPRTFQSFGEADAGGRVVGVDGEGRAVERQAVGGRALVDQGREQVGPAERPRREFVGLPVGGHRFVGEGVRLEGHAVAAPGVAVPGVGAEVGLERGESLADGGLGAVEWGCGDLLCWEGGGREEEDCHGRESRRPARGPTGCGPEGPRTQSDAVSLGARVFRPASGRSRGAAKPGWHCRRPQAGDLLSRSDHLPRPSPRMSSTTWLAVAPGKPSARPSGQTTSKLWTVSAAPRPRCAVAGPAER